jgi:hypothetical protein
MVGAMALAFACVVILGGTAAAAGRLPQPLQDTLASVVRDLGVSLPHSHRFSPMVIGHAPPAPKSSPQGTARRLRARLASLVNGQLSPN